MSTHAPSARSTALERDARRSMLTGVLPKVILLGCALPLSLLGASACAPADAANAEIPPSNLRILHTTSVLGYLEPCGCTAGRIGGIDRIAAYIESENAANPEVLFVDSGDLFCEEPVPDPLIQLQLPLKADAMLAAWSELGCAALAIGENDLNVGVETLLELGERHGVPLICSNLVGADGEPAFEPYTIVERAGLRIGLFSVISQKIRDARVKEALDETPIISVRSLAEAQGLTLEPYVPTAQAMVDELRPQVDLVVMLSHVGHRRSTKVLEAVDGIDFVVGGHVDDADNPTTFVRGVPLFSGALKGARVGQIDLWWQPGTLDLPSGERKWQNLSRRAMLHTDLEAVRVDLRDLEGREPLLGSREYTRQRELSLMRMHGIEEALLPVVPDDGRNALSHVLVPMYSGLGRSEHVLETIDEYHAALDSFWHAEPVESPLASSLYAGPKTCIECHPIQYEFWKATRHSRAFSTLEVTRQHVDAECIGCHTVGFGEARGFRHPAASAGFENVQCAACHGPDRQHTSGGRSFLDPVASGAKRCESCHNHQHSPAFEANRETMLAKVACPSSGPIENATEAYLSALRLGALELESGDDNDLGRASIAYQKAGELGAALDTARRWLAAVPNSQLARVNLADCLIDTGQPEAAAEILSKLVKRNPENVDGWELYSDALLEIDPAMALVASKEAYSLDPNDPRNAARVARACMGLDRRLDAVDTLRAHLEAHPEARAIIAPLLEELTGMSTQQPSDG